MKKKKTIETTGIVNNGKIIYLDVALPFSNDEDIYTLEDGKPFNG